MNTALERLVVWNPANPDEQARPFKECLLNRLGNIALDTLSTGAAKGNKGFSGPGIALQELEAATGA